jgi:PAS domain S-box-containing protein
MNSTIFVLGIVLQAAAGIVALIQVRQAPQRLPWLLIALSSLLIVARRLGTLGQTLQSGGSLTTAEVLTLVISLLFFLGVLLMSSSFAAIRRGSEALRVGEERYAHALSATSDGLWEWEPATGATVYSPQWKAMLGYQEGEIENRISAWERLVHPDDRARVMAAVEDHLQGRSPGLEVEFRMRHQDGRWLDILSRGRVVRIGSQGSVRVVGTHIDITGRKRSEGELRRASLYARSLIEASLDPLVTIAHSGTITDANAAAEAVTGVCRSRLIGSDFSDYFTDPESARIGYRTVLAEGSVRDYPLVIRHAKGGTTAVLYNASVYRDERGEVAGVFAAARDVTAIRSTEAELLRFKTMFDSANFGATICDLQGTMLYVNASFAAAHGFTPAELIGQSLSRLHTREQMVLVARLLQRMRDEGRFDAQEVDHLRRDGSICPMLMTGTAIRDASGAPLWFAATAIDISERKRTEESLRQAEKMNAVGRLAGGVAHDFNNQLTGVIGYAEVLAERLSDPVMQRHARNILTAAHRAADLTQQLLAFSRKGKYLNVPVDMHRIITEVVTLLERSIDKRIVIRQELAADPSSVLGDPTQLQTALLNLAINARDAMPHGGVLTFSTTVVAIPGDQANPQQAAGLHLHIRVSDTGCGMDAESLRHAFEPFFTTKGPGQGTGLGLAAVHGTVRNHRGRITVDSVVDQGTTFSLWLPLPDGAAAARPTPAPPLVRGCARIRVVDDEEMVRALASEMLSSLGHAVTTCADGEQAVTAFKASDGAFDLVVLDLVMPRMGGREAFAALRRINPQVKVILVSGYSIQGEAQGILDEGAIAFLQKPFSLAALAQQVAAALARQPVITSM